MSKIHISHLMEHSKRVKRILESLSKEDDSGITDAGAPISTSSVGYMNPMFTTMASFKKKKKRKLEGYLK